jgi:uracil-DNA glycosylase
MPSTTPQQSRLFPGDKTFAENALTSSLDSHLAALTPAWRQALCRDGVPAALQQLSSMLAKRLQAGAEIYPHRPLRALEYVEPETVRVVILGQDPYHGPNQAQGLAFSVPDACPRPPSLRNIFSELALEFPDKPPRRGNDLTDWACQGVLLLNASLTVEAGKPASHAKMGWEAVTDSIIECVANAPQPKVFLLWGAHAQNKRSILAASTGGPMLVLTANHPSPLSARRPPVPFIGCGHFRQANEWLSKQGAMPVKWL